ncbi:MAG: cytidine deaminase [Armatimonadota bacterium]|nr:cytidine deaminase [Armatimonadota bacterium]
MAELTQREVNHEEMASALRGELLAAAREAQAAAYAPYSNLAVGAAVLVSDGSIYRGCNVENASFGLTVCAERVAVFNAISDGRLDIVAVAVVTSAPKLCKPCGACRQVIAEFSQADNPIFVLSSSVGGEMQMQTITDLLPDTFTLL